MNKKGDIIGSTRETAIFSPWWWLLAAVLISVVAAILLFLNEDDFNGKTEDVVTQSEIVAINLSDEVVGSFESKTFVIVTSSKGEISEESYYKIFAKTEAGGYKMTKLPADQTIIYESGDNPHYEKITTFRQKDVKKWGKVVGTKLDDEAQKVTYKVYVPEGTVKTEYSIN